MRVLEHRGSLSAVRDMRVWLVRIAWNLAIDRRRRRRPEQFDEGFADGLAGSSVPADEALHERQRMKAVLREMERLPKGERHVLLLSAVEAPGRPLMLGSLDVLGTTRRLDVEVVMEQVAQ